MIEFSSVRKEYPSGAVAVDNFSLRVPTGSVTVLVGSSGCGKTTLLRMVNRMVDPTTGVVSIDGISVSERDPVELRRSIGYVMQSGGLLPHKTVADNIQTVAKLRGVPQAERVARVEELMAVVGLDSDGHAVSSAALWGQQQRVGVARALAVDPNILLMDEPFGAVDPLVRSDLQQELLELQRTLAKTVLFVTHDIDEAFLLVTTSPSWRQALPWSNTEPQKRFSPNPPTPSWRPSSARIVAPEPFALWTRRARKSLSMAQVG